MASKIDTPLIFLRNHDFVSHVEREHGVDSCGTLDERPRGSSRLQGLGILDTEARDALMSIEEGPPIVGAFFQKSTVDQLGIALFLTSDVFRVHLLCLDLYADLFLDLQLQAIFQNVACFQSPDPGANP
jgi:hypothetical protein